MGRKKKIITNEIEQFQSNTEETKTTADINIAGEPPVSTENNTEKEKSINDILSQFNTETEEKPVSEVSPSKDEFKPRTRGRKPKEAELPKPVMKVPGKLFLKIHSKVAISAVSMLDKLIDKNNPIPDEYLGNFGLSDDDINDPDLQLMAEAAIKEMKLEDNPISVFYISFGSIILTNYMSMKQLLRAEAIRRKEEFAAQVNESRKQQRRKRNAG